VWVSIEQSYCTENRKIIFAICYEFFNPKGQSAKGYLIFSDFCVFANASAVRERGNAPKKMTPVRAAPSCNPGSMHECSDVNLFRCKTHFYLPFTLLAPCFVGRFFPTLMPGRSPPVGSPLMRGLPADFDSTAVKRRCKVPCQLHH